MSRAASAVPARESSDAVLTAPSRSSMPESVTAPAAAESSVPCGRKYADGTSTDRRPRPAGSQVSFSSPPSTVIPWLSLIPASTGYSP